LERGCVASTSRRSLASRRNIFFCHALRLVCDTAALRVNPRVCAGVKAFCFAAII